MSDDPGLRVVTLNIWNKSGPWRERRSLIQEELTALAPDLVGLQEVLRLDGQAGDSAGDQLAEVNQRLGYHAAFAAAEDYGGGLRFGNALLSRYPIREHTRIALPDLDSGERRSLLYALVEHPLGLLPVFVTHLNWKLHHGSVRQRQIVAVVDQIFRLAPVDDSHLPALLMGDFNAEPDSDEMRFLRGLAAIDGRTVYFTDAWLFAAGAAPGYTFNSLNPYAALAHEPPRRIDYIYVRGPDRKFRGEPLEARLVFDQPTQVDGVAIWPTDHFGVFTRLSLRPQPE